MTNGKSMSRNAFLAALAGGWLASPGAALAADGTPFDGGGVAWVLVSTALVLLMVVPGLALFYGGLVRTKNALSMLSQVFAAVCLCGLLWVLFGYSLAYTKGDYGSIVGGFSKVLLMGVTPQSAVSTSVPGAPLPEYAFIAFQMAFACITPALVVGAFAERMRFTALLIFVGLWFTLVYIPVCHMAWYAAGIDAIQAAELAIRNAVTPDARQKAEAALAAMNASAGLYQTWGVLDYAGGTVVHISAGVSGLIGAVMLGKRVGYGRDNMAPHSLTLAVTGAALLWVGWFGFNGGSALRADSYAALAVLNTFVAGAAGAFGWLIAEWAIRTKPSILGIASGTLSGLVAVTPAAGYVSPGGALVLALVAGAACFWFATAIKARFQYDDSLDVFGVHAVAGVIGALAVGILASPRFGGTGVIEFVSGGQAVTKPFDILTQMTAQTKAVLVTVLWAGIVSSRLYKLVDSMVGLRVDEDDEDQGLDLVDHGERAYNT